MKKQLIIAALSLTACLFTACNNQNKTEDTKTTETETTAKYQCPMKCEADKTYDKPGQCPECNMDLEKVAR